MMNCKQCLLEKPFSEFYKAARGKAGYRGTCKACLSDASKKRYEKKNFVGHNQRNLPMPSIERLKELFDYKDNGALSRKISRGTQKAGVDAIGRLENKSGYRRICVDREYYLFHRIVWKWHYGDEPEFIDHINGSRQDNRISNLRRVTKSSNCQHQLLQKNNTSGFFGVYWCNWHKKWKASISVNGKKVTLGARSNLKDAVLIYNEACNRLHGEFGKRKIIHNTKQLEVMGLI